VHVNGEASGISTSLIVGFWDYVIN